MELPEKLVNKFKELELKDKARENKVKSRVMYNRRKLDKDVREYTRSRRRICSRDIDAIGIKHKFIIEESPFREDKPPHKNA